MKLRDARQRHGDRRATMAFAYAGVVAGGLYMVLFVFGMLDYWPRVTAMPIVPIVGTIAALSLGYLGLVHVWPLRMFCEHCQKYIPSDMHWVCGWCGQVHVETDWHSFLHACRNCQQRPRGLKCPHCGRGAFRGRLEDSAHWAYKEGDSPMPTVSPDDNLEAERSREKARLQHDIQLNDLYAERARSYARARQAEEQLTPPASRGPTKSERERLREDLDTRADKERALDEIVEEKLAEARQRFSDDPEALADYEDWIERWKEEHIL